MGSRHPHPGPLICLMLLVAVACDEPTAAAAVLQDPPDSVLQNSAVDTALLLKATIGPLSDRHSPVAAMMRLDSRYLAAESKWWQAFLANESNTDVVVVSNHYGTLRSRLQWAIRNGQPYGPAATNEATQVYARGRRMLRKYLDWSEHNGYAIPPHNNTGMPDLEAYYVLEGDPRVVSHFTWFAANASWQRQKGTGDNYLHMNRQSTDGRWMYEALESFSFMYRFHIAHANAYGFTVDPACSDWVCEGEAQINIIDAGLPADGSFPSQGEGGREDLLFSATLAEELMKWDAFVAPNPTAVQLAKRIMGHILQAWEAVGRQVLPYQYLNGAPTTPAPDLAGYYVWPSLVMWQETGDIRYRDMALVHLDGTKNAWIDGGVKQFNQVFSTGAQNAEALLSGISWR